MEGHYQLNDPGGLILDSLGGRNGFSYIPYRRRNHPLPYDPVVCRYVDVSVELDNQKPQLVDNETNVVQLR